MPAIAIIADVVIDVAVSSVAADLGATVLEAAIIGGAVAGGVTTSAQGGDFWKGAFKGGITAGIGSEVSSTLLGTSGGVDAAGNATEASKGLFGTYGTGGEFGSGVNAATAGERALAQGLGTTIGQVATGTPLKTALETGGIAGLTSYAFPSQGSNDYASAIERGLTQQGLMSLITPKSQGGIPSLGAAPITGQYAQSQTTPGTAALGQALGVGGTESPVLGGGTDNTSKKNVWNVESLRYMGGGETPSEQANG